MSSPPVTYLRMVPTFPLLLLTAQKSGDFWGDCIDMKLTGGNFSSLEGFYKDKSQRGEGSLFSFDMFNLATRLGQWLQQLHVRFSQRVCRSLQSS